MINITAMGCAIAGGIVVGMAKRSWDNRDIKKLKKDWKDTLLKCNVQGIRNKDKDGVEYTFILIDVKRCENGFKAHSVVPRGLSFAALENAVKTLEDNLNAKISINKSWDCKFINIEIINNKPKYTFAPVKCGCNKLFLGYQLDGKPFLLDLDLNPSCGFTGQSGAGKTWVKYLAITNLLYNYKNDFDMYICQTINNDDMIFSECKPVKGTATNYQEAKKLLEKIEGIANSRSEKYKSHNLTEFSQWNTNMKNKDKRIFILLDEFSFFTPEDGDTPEDKKLKDECGKVFKRLSKAGRGMGIHILPIVQKLTSENISTTIRSQLAILSLVQFSTSDSQVAIGTSDAKYLKNQEAIIKAKGIYEQLFEPYIPVKEMGITIQEYLHQWVPEIKIPSKSEVSATLAPQVNSSLTYEETQKLKERAKVEHMRVCDEYKKLQEGKTEEVKTTNGKHDKEVFKFIETFGGITIKQYEQLFGVKNNNAGRALKRLVDAKQLVSYNYDKSTKEKIYKVPEGKDLTKHEVLINNFYSKLIAEGAQILEVNRYPHILKDARRPDLYVRYKYKNKEYRTYLEVDYTHYTDDIKLNDYDTYWNQCKEKFNLIIMKEGELRTKYKGNMKINTIPTEKFTIFNE